MLPKFGWMAAIVLAFSASALAANTLTRDGKSEYVIVVADDAGPPERTVAKNLAECLRQVTGAQHAVANLSDLGGNKVPRISVGRTKLAQKALADVEWDELGHDGIVLRTVGDDLFLAGGQPRGSVYAVNTFLEDVVGVRWWTSDESAVPHKPTLEIGDQNVTYIPKLAYRDSYNYDATAGGNRAIFASRLKLNGHNQPIQPE